MGVTAKHCKELIKDYCANCTFAGIHFIADETKHWLERLLWLFLVILSWYGSFLLIIAALDAFVNNPISFGAETTYLSWQTEMPAVAVCETMNDKVIYNVSDTIWTPKHLLDLEDALRDIAYFRGVSYTLVEVCYKKKNPDPQCPTTKFRYYADLVRSSCQDLIANCSYNGMKFNCCDYFQPIETDIGVCYIINSIQTVNPNPLLMISNRSHSRGVINFDVKLQAMVYTIEADEVPTITTLKSSTIRIQLGQNYQRQVTMRNIENDPLIVQTTSKQRACRFHDENEGGVYPVYSYSACNVLCRKTRQIELCGCNDHFMLGTNESERCNMSGLACLHNYKSDLTLLKPYWASRPGLVCDCLPACEETELTVIKDAAAKLKGKGSKAQSGVEVVLAYLATEQFKRSVVRSRLDLVVSVGGTTGLFVGASLLSFVELIFFFTVRFISNIMMYKRKRHHVIPITYGAPAGPLDAWGAVSTRVCASGAAASLDRGNIISRLAMRKASSLRTLHRPDVARVKTHLEWRD